MGKTYRGDDKKRLTEKYKQEREKRQKKRHIDDSESDKGDVSDRRLPRNRYSEEG